MHRKVIPDPAQEHTSMFLTRELVAGSEKTGIPFERVRLLCLAAGTAGRITDP